MIAATVGVAAALSVSPVRIRLSRAVSRTITIMNTGNASASVGVRPASFALDLRGRPMVAHGGRAAVGWLRVQPSRVALAPGGKAAVSISSVVPPGALPGDHAAIVLLETQPAHAAGVAIQVRIGVVVFVRVGGRIVHRLQLGTLSVRRHVLELVVANRGNVVEREHVKVTLLQRGHVLARLQSAGRTLLPHSRGTERFRCPGRLRGGMTARIELGALRRSFRISVR